MINIPKINFHGDILEDGEYFLHSSFSTVINFHSKASNNYLLSFSRNLLKNPSSINVNHGFFNLVCDAQKIIIENDNLQIYRDDRLSSFYIGEKHKIYSSRINIETPIEDHLDQAIDKAIEILKSHSSSIGMLYLLDSSKEKYVHGRFNQALMENFKEAIELLYQKSDISSAIKKLKGVGHGLTPSGDDYILGLIAATFIIEKTIHKDLNKLRTSLFELAIGENKFSNTYLYFASNGNFNELLKKFMEALITNSNIENTLNELINFGSTSGADIATGLLQGLQRRNSWLPKD